MKKYCFNCGSKLEFSVRDKPKFCAQCGKPLESESPSYAHDEDEELHENLQEEVNINIKGLEFDFDPELLAVQKNSIESLMGTLDKVSGNTPTGLPVVSRDEMMEQYRKEAGTLRDSKSLEKDGEG